MNKLYDSVISPVRANSEFTIMSLVSVVESDWNAAVVRCVFVCTSVSVESVMFAIVEQRSQDSGNFCCSPELITK